MLLCVLATAERATAQGPDPFYASLLRDGELLSDQGKFAAAAKSLRIACFGMLDEPSTLTRCLVRLGVAQGSNGDSNGFRETFSRLLELESHTPAYAKAEIPAPVRAAFEEQVKQRIPATTLAASATFQALAASDAHQSGKKNKRAHAAEASEPPSPAPAVPPTKPPRPPEAVATPPTPQPVPEKKAPAPPVAPSTPPKPAAAPALSSSDRATLASAREHMRAARVVAELSAQGADAKRIADAHLDSVEANALAGEIAYRSSRWADAVVYLRRAGPPSDQPLLGFYLAVALFETGDKAGAAATLKPLLPKLQRTPYVQGYAQKILPP